MLIWCLKQVKDLILRFNPSINGSFFLGRQNIKFTVHVILSFFTSGTDADKVLIRWYVIEQIIKDANLMCILFSFKYPQIFQES